MQCNNVTSRYGEATSPSHPATSLRHVLYASKCWAPMKADISRLNALCLAWSSRQQGGPEPNWLPTDIRDHTVQTSGLLWSRVKNGATYKHIEHCSVPLRPAGEDQLEDLVKYGWQWPPTTWNNSTSPWMFPYGLRGCKNRPTPFPGQMS